MIGQTGEAQTKDDTAWVIKMDNGDIEMLEIDDVVRVVKK